MKIEKTIKCRKCGKSFKIDLTKPKSKCPNCGDGIEITNWKEVKKTKESLEKLTKKINIKL